MLRDRPEMGYDRITDPAFNLLKHPKINTLSPAKQESPPPLIEQTADYQRLTREQHAQERAQDYVEAIADLIRLRGEARAVDLARSLGVTHVTVISTVERLMRDGLVTTEPYRSIFLTEKGCLLAAQVKKRHETVIAFLEALGISPSVARADAEGIEHHVSEETLAAFEKHLGLTSS